MESDFRFGINLGSPHQTEGAPAKNDFQPTLSKGWWTNPKLFSRDLELAKELGVSVVRMGTEWARVEPEHLAFDRKTLRRYGEMVQEVRDARLQPMLNLHHFTLPEHVASYGGWANPKIVFDFLTYLTEVSIAIGEVPYIITTNEPSVFLTNGYLKGIWPPFLRGSRQVLPAFDNLIRAHNNAYRIVKEMYPLTQVGATEAIRGFSPANPLATREARFREFFWNTLFFRLTQNDFYGVNYSRDYPLKTGSSKKPAGFKASVKRFAKSMPEKPIIITENGVNDPTDQVRPGLLKENIQSVQELRQEGLPIQGFLPWTLTDNYEWFEPLGSCRMGLAKVDFETGKRTPRPSFRTYQEICQRNDIILSN